MATFNSDPTLVARLQNQQLLQKFRQENDPGAKEAAVEAAKAKLVAEGKRIVDKAKTTQTVSEYLLLKDVTLSLPHSGPIRFRIGQRISDMYIVNQLKAAGAELKPIVG